jgi:hypothetical protein
MRQVAGKWPYAVAENAFFTFMRKMIKIFEIFGNAKRVCHNLW